MGGREPLPSLDDSSPSLRQDHAMTPHRFLLSFVLLALVGVPAAAADLPRVHKVELQPLAAQVQRLVQALDSIGAPLPDADKEALRAAGEDKDEAKGADAIQAVLDKHCLAGVRIAAADKVEVQAGAARAELA